VPPSPSSVQTTPNDPLGDPSFVKAVELRKSGRLEDAVSAFEQIAVEARANGDLSKETRALRAKGGAQLRLFTYREAVQTYFRVVDLARQIHDDDSAGAALSNLAELHIQLNDLAAAENEATEAVRTLANTSRADYLSRAEIQVGSIAAAQKHYDRAIDAYYQAIALANAKATPADEALAWLILSDALEQANDLKAAEHAMIEAYRLQVLNHDPAIEITRAKLAELEFLKGYAAVALRLLDSALSHRAAILAEIPEHQILYRRAQMLAALGRRAGGLVFLPPGRRRCNPLASRYFAGRDGFSRQCRSNPLHLLRRERFHRATRNGTVGRPPPSRGA
jgi:tetratricopeptide (TPR) repeat protein